MDLRTPLPRTGLLVASTLLLVVGLAGCGKSDKTSAGGATTTTAASGTTGGTDGYSSADNGGNDGGAPSSEEYVVVAKDFSLTDLTVGAGESFTLDNQGSATHTVTADDGSFDSGKVDGGKTSDPITAPSKAGTYTFHCAIHSSMTGTLTVT